MERIVILTGAGISAESGLATFRDAGGIWARHAIEDVATPEAFGRSPGLVQAFYNARRAQAARAVPNAAHAALARLEARWRGEVTIITQNVDDLHERAGSRNVLHMHGRLSGALCHACGHRWPAPSEMRPETACPSCGAQATRPDVVWFGEIPRHLDRIDAALGGADLFVAIGTSGQVYPAAGLAREARRRGARTLELNLEAADTPDFDERRRGPATRIVPAWVAEVLARPA